MHVNGRPFAVVATGLAAAAGAGCGDGGHSPATTSPDAATTTTTAAAALTTVPELVGRHREDAHRLAARAGLRVRWMGYTGKAASGRYEIGCVKVLRQSPVAGERRPRGASVAIIEEACRTPKQRAHGV